MNAGSLLGGRIGRALDGSGMSFFGVRCPGVFDNDLVAGVKAPDFGVRIPTDFAALLVVCFLLGGDACSSEARFNGL
jgi:hypothetical protein